MPYKLPEIFDKQLGRNQPPPPEPVAVVDPDKLPGKQPDPSDPVKVQAYQLYLMGWKKTQIARECNLPVKKVDNWIFKDGWLAQKEFYERKKSKLHGELSDQPIVQAVVTANRAGRRQEFLEHTGQMAVEDAKHWQKMGPKRRLENAQEIAALNKVGRDNLDLNSEESSNAKGHISLHFLTEADKPGYVKVIDAPVEVQRIEDKE